MFTHLVLLQIKKKDVTIYRRDCKLWAREARKHKGFLEGYTFQRTNEKNQYASCYVWKCESDHHRFMKRHHDRLVLLSKCPVKVLGYYNFKSLDHAAHP